MGFWEKIQKDINEGLAIVREGSAVFSQRIEQLTEEGKRKYQVLTLNMKVQDEFSKLGGKIYDLSFKKKNPMTDKRVLSIITRINKLEEKITTLEKKHRNLTRAARAKKKTGKAVRKPRVHPRKRKVSTER
jgi:TPP-dependent indolepyruvate ferredoxin oxidoreductase alpha subunit